MATKIHIFPDKTAGSILFTSISLCTILAMIHTLSSKTTLKSHSLQDLNGAYHGERFFDNWMECAPRYEAHLPDPGAFEKRNRTIRLLHIGLQSEGSVRVWKQYYGQNLLYTGLDVDPRSKQSERLEESIFIEIGPQEKQQVLGNVCQKYGPFDVVIYDGGDKNQTITAPLLYLFPRTSCMAPESIYVIQNIHRLIHGSNFEISDTLAALLATTCKYRPNQDAMGDMKDKRYEEFSGSIKEIHLYDSIVFISRGEQSFLAGINQG